MSVSELNGIAAYDNISEPVLQLVFAVVSILLLILFLILFCVLLVELSKKFCIHRLEYKRYFSEEGVFEGEEIFLIEEFTNHSFLPMFLVDIETHIPSMIKMQGCESDDDITQRFISRFMVMPFTKIRRVHKAVCKKRGYYQLETAMLTYARLEVYLDSKTQLSVYPQEIPLKEQEILSNYLQYSAMSKRPLIQDPFSFAGVRKYQSGDAMNTINYKSSAKYGEFMVNAREYMMGRKILIYVNFQPNEELYIPLEEFSELLEKQLRHASYLLGECMRNGYQYAFHANCKMISGENRIYYPFSNGESAYREVLLQMAQMRSIYGESMAAVMERDIEQCPNGVEIFLFSMYINEALLQRIGALEKLGNVVNVVNILS